MKKWRLNKKRKTCRETKPLDPCCVAQVKYVIIDWREEPRVIIISANKGALINSRNNDGIFLVNNIINKLLLL